jgi:hypothetical protein
MLTVGAMAAMFPWCCGLEDEWSALGDLLQKRYDALPLASKLNESTFEGRGAYGHYFAPFARSSPDTDTPRRRSLWPFGRRGRH